MGGEGRRFALDDHDSVRTVEVSDEGVRMKDKQLCPSLYPPLLRLSDFHPNQQTYLRRLPSGTVSTRETCIRAFVALYWVWAAWAELTSLHDLLAVLFRRDAASRRAAGLATPLRKSAADVLDAAVLGEVLA